MNAWDYATEALVSYGPKLVLALAVLWGGLWLIKRLAVVFDHRAEKRKMDPSLRPFLRTMFTVGLKVLLLISVASMIGITVTSFVAVIGAAGLAVGLALQGSLANFAGGVLILGFRPFKVGDVIEAMGFVGKVHEIQVFNTVLKTPDNKTIILPNGTLSNSSLVNLSSEPNRRVDLKFGVSRAEDVAKVKAAVIKVVEDDLRIADEPAPYCRLSELSGGAATYDIRVWCAGEHYFAVMADLLENLKREFELQQIAFPTPAMHVQVKNGAGDRVVLPLPQPLVGPPTSA
jgi:small conductance mechanosensitive channel